MNRACISLFFIFLLNGIKAFPDCTNDSTIINFTDSSYDGNVKRRSYQQIVYHTDSGSFDNCTYNYLNNAWVLESCNSGFYSDVIRSYNSYGQILEETTRHGTINGWVYDDSHTLTYNSNWQITSENFLFYNGTGWDTSVVSIWIYDAQNNLIGFNKTQHINGTNISRFQYYTNSGRKDSVIYQRGQGQSWINDSMFTFDYSGNLRTGLNIYRWNTINNTWDFFRHVNYSGPDYRASIDSYGDTLFIGSLIMCDTSRYEIDTLENVLFRSTLRLPHSGSYGDYVYEEYKIINNVRVFVRGGDAMVLVDTDANQTEVYIDFSCSSSERYYYDSIPRVVRKELHSRCVMPYVWAWEYTYDSAGFCTDIEYTFESNMHDGYALNTYSYTLGNEVQLHLAPWEVNKFCKGTTYQPSFVLSGGCGPYTIRWTPSAGLSSDTILNPQITLLDSIDYTITFTDQNGTTGTYVYSLSYPFMQLQLSCQCQQNNWGRISILSNTNLNDFNYYQWYRDSIPTLQGYWNLPVNQAGDYFVTAKYQSMMCDLSSDTISIAHSPVIANTEQIRICQGRSYVLPCGLGVNSAGTYYSPMPNGSGCDSVIVTQVTILPNYYLYENKQICNGDVFVLPSGITVDSAGYYWSYFTNASGCDSIINTRLSILPILSSVEQIQICSGDVYVLPNGQVVDSAGTYSSIITSTLGCDSTIISHVTVNPIFTSIEQIQICSGDTYVLPNGQSVNSAGTYYSTFTNTLGCDSIIVSQVTINPAFSSIEQIQICSGDTYVLPNGQSVNSAGTYYSTFTNTLGCDSIIVSQVTIIQVQSNSITDSISVNQQYVLPDGQIVTQPGVYTCILASSTGCDSVVIVSLFLFVTTNFNGIEGNQLFNLYPVPVTEELEIHTELTQDLIIRIMALNGQVIVTNYFRQDNIKINMHDLSSGSYVVAVFMNGTLIYRRLIEKI